MKLKRGQRFGMLVVQSWNEQRKAWSCQCDCGGNTHARAWALKNGKHSRCSCGKTATRPATRLPNELGVKREIMRLYQKAAQKRGYDFLLSEEQFIALIKDRCYYCDSKPEMVLNYYKHAKERNFRHNGIDRLDNSIGYTNTNSVSCCKVCNNAKAGLTVEDFKTWIQKVHTSFIIKGDK